MAQVNWTDEAERWLSDIHDFIAEDNPAAAARVVEGIHEKVRLLLRFPQLGHRYEEVSELEVRVLLYGHYRIAYLVKVGGNIDILGVFHGALDIHRYLQ